MTIMRRTLAIVVPAKNEEKYLGKVLDSIVANIEELSIPLKVHVVVVDDSSNDNTPLIAKEYSKKYEYVSHVRLKHTKGYDSSIGLVRAVKSGLKYIETRGIKWDFFMQVDADTILLRGYIENVTKPLLTYDRIGIIGGITVNEPQARFHIRNTGMTIRKEVWVRCGGYKPFPSPDTIIQLCSIAHGWKIAVVRNAKMILLRPTRLNVYRAGLVDAVTGSSLFYTFARSVRFTLSHMTVKSLVDYWAGYIAGRINSKLYADLSELKPYKRLIEKMHLKTMIARIFVQDIL